MNIKNSSKQQEYYRLIEKYDLLFLTGAAGTGKTYVACNSALNFLERGLIEKIIITRPVVATEDIGFLPGTLEEKINPFMDPIVGVLSEIYNSKEIKKMIANNVIEAVPLAYMRGRTFSNSFIILDEAQNTTQKQMSMFLTRFGRNIKCCITGDLLQSDLPTRENGLNWASSKLSPSDLVAFLTFTSDHVVRSPLVKEIMRYLYAEETSYPIKKAFRAGSLESIAPREVVNS